MLPDYPSSRRNTPVPILVIEDSKDHQLLIAHHIQISLPQVVPFVVDSAKQALTLLSQTAAESDIFPRLVLLDLDLPEAYQGWQLLVELRRRYPLLPVIVLSSQLGVDVVSKAYELGVRSFVVKPTDPENWSYYFQAFAQHWMNIIS